MTECSRVGATVPIGRPIANTQIYLLDGNLEPVPIGVAGELHIGGAGLARGYLGRPELTAEKFIPDPFGRGPGGRLYRSGDLARYLEDGNIEFVGRMDQQVKIRGYRIELGEIEAVLRQHGGVREGVVMVREDEPGEKRLVAYVVADQERIPNVSELRGHLKEKLPEYMIPGAFVMLESLPLTPNGKVDRRRLPVPEQIRPELEQGYQAARTMVEEILVGIWSEVLGVKRVGVEDNFFELGGHSLLATQVVSRVRQLFEVELPLRSLFEAPILADLAEKVEAHWSRGQIKEAVALVTVSRQQELPLSYAQERLWFLDQLEPGNKAYHIPLAVRLRGRLQVEVMEEMLSKVVQRHEVLRTGFGKVEGRGVQVIVPGEAVELRLRVVDLEELAEENRKPKY
jgi:acyl carrier protein